MTIVGGIFGVSTYHAEGKPNTGVEQPTIKKRKRKSKQQTQLKKRRKTIMKSKDLLQDGLITKRLKLSLIQELCHFE
ncbi:MAG TPA: hypothetical protein VEY70_21545 [Metabacillus sp.]|nr:hypothetical protein [Metabacillus sp.]